MANCTIDNSSNTAPCSTDAEYILYVYIFSTFCYSGILLNILNITVFVGKMGQTRRRHPTFVMLPVLAVYDLCYLVFLNGIWICRCLPASHDWEVYVRSYYEIYVYMPVSNTFGSASVFLTVLIAVERCMCIRHNNTYRRICQKHTVTICLVACFLLALGMNMPYFFFKEVDDQGQKIYTDFGNSDEYQQYEWARLVLNKVVPLIMIVISNMVLGITVVMRMRQARTVALSEAMQVQRQRQQTRVSVMMISISAILVACHVMEPFIHTDVAQAVFGPCSIYTDAYKTLSVVVNTLEVFSHASNFIFYCVFNSSFREGLRELVCSHRLRHKVTPLNTVSTKTIAQK